MLYIKHFSVAISDVTIKAELPAMTFSPAAKIIHILNVKYINYGHISLLRLNYSNYAFNTPQ